MRKTVQTLTMLSLAGAAFFIAPTAGATEVTPSPVCTPVEAVPAVDAVTYEAYKFERTVVVTPAVPGKEAVTETKEKWSKSNFIKGWENTGETRTVVTTPAVEAVAEVSHQEYRFQRTVIDQPYVPGTPAVPAKTEPYLISEAVPAQAEEAYTRYQYNKQTMTVREHKHGKVEHVSDWSWWAGNAPRWSNTNPGVLESGLHGVWTEGPWTYTRTYRYVATDVTEKVVTKPAVPGKDAVWGTREISPAIPAVPETPEVSHVETTDWVREAPAGEGWVQIDERKVVDAEAVAGVPEVSHVEYRHTKTVVLEEAVAPVEEVTKTETSEWVTDKPEGEGWEQVEQKTVVVKEAVPAVEGVECPVIPEVPETPETPVVTPPVIVNPPVVNVPVTVITPEVPASTPPSASSSSQVQPSVSASQPQRSSSASSQQQSTDSGLAHTGSNAALLGTSAALLAAAGVGLTAAARRRNNG